MKSLGKASLNIYWEKGDRVKAEEIFRTRLKNNIDFVDYYFSEGIYSSRNILSIVDVQLFSDFDIFLNREVTEKKPCGKRVLVGF